MCLCLAITCASDDVDKVLHPAAVTELPLRQGGAVPVVVQPDGQVQRVGERRAQVHRRPLLDQLGGVQDHTLLRVDTPPRGHTWPGDQRPLFITLSRILLLGIHC